MLNKNHYQLQMLEPLRHILDKSIIVLASGSPRRKEILTNIGLSFIVQPSNVEENLDKSKYDGKPFNYTMDTAALKTDDIFRKIDKEYADKPLIVIGCDTVVTYKGNIYEKPRDKADAFRILSELNGSSHSVYSGVKLIYRPVNGDKKEVSFYEETKVEFADLTDDIIRAYIETEEPMDKAGGYGIQAKGGTLVKAVNGEYFNVMGFPVYMFSVKLSSLLL